MVSGYISTIRLAQFFFVYGQPLFACVSVYLMNSIRLRTWMVSISVCDHFMISKEYVRTGIGNVLMALVRFLGFSFIFRNF